jgi:multisubunit Na+/H+ antiporter MnhG subunit
MIHSTAALLAILLTNPVGAHAIARAAHRSGVKPVGAVVDELAEKPMEQSRLPQKTDGEEIGGR